MRKTYCLYTNDYDKLINMMINDYYSCIKWEMKYYRLKTNASVNNENIYIYLLKIMIQ